ncbi:Urease, beta subunit, partial [Rhizopogon salebrosus TDB-379]
GKTLLRRRYMLPSVPPCLHEIQVEGMFLDDGDHDHLPRMSSSAIVAKKERVTTNARREHIRLKVTNNGDRPIQVSPVGSHHYFTETNVALEFGCVKANGMRLDILASTAVRFEHGAHESKTVTLCAIAGNKIITGGNSIASLIGML